MNKSRFIDQLQEGDRIDEVFLVKSSKLAETRAGKPYLLVSLTDKSGEIGGPIWENAEKLAEICQAGKFVQLKGQVQSYRDNLQLRIDFVIAVLESDVDLADFMAASDNDLDEMADQFRRVIASVENSWVRKLLNRFFKKDELWAHFKNAPAAKGIHHAYVGGLMEHSLSMVKVADMLASHYAGVDRSILLAGVILHDIGKLKELEAEIGLVNYTPQGRLKGHLVIGSEMVGEAAAKIKDFPEDLLIQIQHLILSHHGKLEFGSPTVPMTTEAFLLSYIDDLDSKMNLIEQLRRKQKKEGLQWSEYQRSLERYLYLEPLSKNEEESASVEDISQRQQTLF